MEQSRYFAHMHFYVYSQGKDVDEESGGKIVEPVEHWSPPDLNEIPGENWNIIGWKVLVQKVSHVMSE